MVQFQRAGMLETGNLAALRVNAGHHVPNRTVLAGSIHCLEDQKEGVAITRILHLLLLDQFSDLLVQHVARTVFSIGIPA